MNTETCIFGSRKANAQRYKSSNIIGATDGGIAHILSESKKTKHLKQTLTNNTVQGIEDSNGLSVKLAFERNTDKKIRNRLLHNIMEQNASLHKQNLNKRREKLRMLFNTEEQCFMKELAEQMERNQLLKKTELASKVETEKKQEIESNQLEVAAKRMQQYLAKCPEVRSNFSKKSAVDVKHCNLAQVEEKIVKKQVEKELDQMWNKMTYEKLEEEKNLMEENRKREAQMKSTMASEIRNQIAEKLARQAEETRAKEIERKRLEELMESIKSESLAEMEKKREERKKLKADLDKQLELVRKRIAENAAEEEALDGTFASLDQDVQDEKIMLKKSSKALNDELLAYIQSVKDFREQQAKRDAELDNVISEIAKQAEEKRDQERIQEQEARKRELQEVLEIRAKQLQDKLAQRKQEKEQRVLEEKMMEEQRRMEECMMMEKNKSKRLSALRYAEELKAQKEQTEALQRKQREEIELMYQRAIARDEEYLNKINSILNSSKLSTPHGCMTQIQQLSKLVDQENAKTNFNS